MTSRHPRPRSCRVQRRRRFDRFRRRYLAALDLVGRTLRVVGLAVPLLLPVAVVERGNAPTPDPAERPVPVGLDEA